MAKPKLIRITTVPISLEKLLEGQLVFMQDYFEVIAVSADADRLKHFGEVNNVETFCVDMTRKITPFKDFSALVKLFRFLKKEKPAIVHTHTPKAGIVGMLAAKLAGVPHRFHTVAGLPLMEATGTKLKILTQVEKLTYGAATKVFPNSEGLKDFIIDEKLTNPGKVKIIGAGSSNGIDTSHFDPEKILDSEKENLRKELKIEPEDFVFVFVGRLVGDKGINEMVSAFQQLRAKNEKFKLILVGSLEAELDPLSPKTLQEIEKNPGIISTGFQNDVRPYLAIAHALVFPSYREGFPNVVLQAQAMGLPAIVSNINGCNEIVQHGKNGLIVPVKDENALKTAMEKLYKNNGLFDKLKMESRKGIVSRYQRQEIWNALLDEYNTLLNAKKE